MSGRRDPLRVLVLSDSHLSPRTPEADSNWDAAVARLDRVDVVLHAGDLTLSGSVHETELEYAREHLDALAARWMAIPGNHDIGNNPGAVDGPPVDAERIERWRRRIGPDWWRVDVGGWTIVGVDCQLFESGLDAEAEQWSWLEGCLASQPAGRRVVLVTHKPLTASDAELAAAPRERFVRASARERLAKLLDGVDCPLVLGGHVHQYRDFHAGGRRQVWAPTTWAVLPDRIQGTVGLKRCGVVRLDLEPDGTSRATLDEPPGLVQHTLADTVPNPYRH